MTSKKKELFAAPRHNPAIGEIKGGGTKNF
jgi:hypothetical protein